MCAFVCEQPKNDATGVQEDFSLHQSIWSLACLPRHQFKWVKTLIKHLGQVLNTKTRYAIENFRSTSTHNRDKLTDNRIEIHISMLVSIKTTSFGASNHTASLIECNLYHYTSCIYNQLFCYIGLLQSIKGEHLWDLKNLFL